VTDPRSSRVRATRRRALAGRRSERGAAVFVVVLAITMLTAVGLFAAHSATLVDQASGYARLARQTQYIAEYGTLAGAAELGSGSAEPYLKAMLTGANACRANAVDPATARPPCYKMFYANLDARTSNPLTVDESGEHPQFVGVTSDGTDGSFADFVVELTDPGPTGAPVAGTDLGGAGLSFRYVKVTATTTAQLRPPGNTCDNAITTVTGQQSLRAHLVIGPIQQ